MATTDVVVADAKPYDASDLCRQYEAAKTLRTNYEGDWKIITEHVRPQMMPLFNEGASAGALMGTANRRKARDAKAAIALERFVAMITYMMTPQGSRWHGLSVPDPALAKKERVRKYFADLSELLFSYRAAPEAGFAKSRYHLAMGLGLFGNGLNMTTAPRRIHKALPARIGLQYRSFALPQLYFVTDADGKLCAMFRRMILSPRQIKQMWGDRLDRVGARVRHALEKGQNIDAMEHEFFHYVGPREDHEPDEISLRRFPFTEQYVCVETKQVVDESGYRTWPFNIMSGSTVAGEVYGRGPAHLSLASIMTANDMKRVLLKQGQRAVDPVLLAHDDGVVGDLSLVPGAVNYGAVDSQGRLLVHALEAGRVDIGEKLLEAERKDTSDAFYETLWLILVERPERTATEVLELLREKGALVAPLMSILQDEDLGALIPREIDVLAQQGKLPELPPELEEADGEYSIQYTSPLAKAMNLEGVTGFMRLSAFAAEAAHNSGSPRPMRRLNFDAALPQMADALSVPPGWLHNDAELDAMDEEDKQAQAVQQVADAAPAIAGLAKATGGKLPA